MKRHTTTTTHTRKAFSLVELISVFLIIGLLIALAISVGRSVMQTRGEKATQNVVQVLDQALSTYIAIKNAKPSAYYTDAAGVKFPVIDGRIGAGGPAALPTDLVPSTSLAILQMQEVPEVKAILSQIPSEFIRRETIVVAGQTVQATNSSGGGGGGGAGGGGGGGANVGLVIVDAWGSPIRYVHPEFHGRIGDAGAPLALSIGNFTRLSTADFEDKSDADEGYCPNNRPYFYSCGPDRKAGTRKDNIYGTRPTFASETTQQIRPN